MSRSGDADSPGPSSSDRLPRVLEVGPHPTSAGGIASVIESLIRSPLRDRYEIITAPTYVDGGTLRKSTQAVYGLVRTTTLLAARRADVVHIHTSSGASFWRKGLACMIARATGTPYVLHVHSGDFVVWYESAHPLEAKLVRSALGHAAFVVGLSPLWEKRLQAIAPCRTVSIPNPIDIPERPARPAMPPTIVCLGRLGDAKGSGTLLRAFARVSETHPDASLVLAGDGDRELFRREAVRLAVSDRVALPGWVGADERKALLAHASVFALPSRGEGMPVSLLEAMGYGLPSVVTPVGSVPEVVRDGIDAFLVPPDDPEALADRIRLLLDEPETAARMGAAARASACSRFSLDRVGAQVADVLDAARLTDPAARLTVPRSG